MHNYPILALDFESFYGPKYSLTVMTTKDYIMDKRFKVHGCGFRWLHEDGETTRWISGHEAVKAFFGTIDWTQTAVLCQNANFDAFILKHRFGISPAFIHDTAAMGRMHEPRHKCGLDAMAARYLKQNKGKDLIRTYGIVDLSPELDQVLGSYCILDTDLMCDIYEYLLPFIPFEQQQIIDIAIRLHTEPKLQLNVERVTKFRDYERTEAERKILESGLTKGQLASNDKFAVHLQTLGLEVPMKPSPSVKDKMIPAFAQSDIQFQDLQDDHPELQDLWDARQAAKSRLNETRAQRFLDARMPDGSIPMPLKVAGAHTFRFSGFDSMNVQNLPRGGELRKSLLAPHGYMVCVIDLSQIEARINAWLAGQEDLVDVFREGGDPYVHTAEKVFKRKVIKGTEEGDKYRFIGKTCLSADTQVLTGRGWIPIVDIELNDQLWDGAEWVSHQGVSFMGVKPTISLSGVELTPDHEILTEHTKWVQAQFVLQNPTVFQSALNTATLPSLAMNNAYLKMENLGDGAPFASANDADQHTHIWATTLEADDQRRVTRAQNKKHPRNDIGNTKALCPTTSIDHDFSTDSTLLSPVVIAQPQNSTKTMDNEVYTSAKNGETIKPRFCAISRLSPDGMSPNAKWTEPTTIKDTSRATFGLQADPRTRPINDELLISKPVYDILSSGSRNRFTILSNDGPVIVHNCVLGLGYGMGATRFARVLRAGAMGPKYPITDEEAQHIVSTWRTENFMIPRLWETCKSMLFRMMDRSEHAPWNYGPLTVTRERIELPSGLRLHYPDLKYEDGNFLYWIPKGKYWTKTFGGKQTENNVQSLANCIITEALLRVQPYLKEINGSFVLQVHDELVFLVPERDAEVHGKELARLITINPDWCLSMPIACSAPGIAKEYSK